MEREPTRKPTGRQRDLLTKARDAIRDSPETFDQRTYGKSRINCRTPACVAGHIVASSRKLRQQVTTPSISHDSNAAERFASRIQQAAMQGLGLIESPALFRSTWPIAWRPADSKTPVSYFENYRFTPTARDAVKVLDAILEGRNTEALSRG